MHPAFEQIGHQQSDRVRAEVAGEIPQSEPSSGHGAPHPHDQGGLGENPLGREQRHARAGEHHPPVGQLEPLRLDAEDGGHDGVAVGPRGREGEAKP